MQLLAVLPDLAAHLATSAISAADEAPKPKDVKAGWVALVVFLAMILAVAVLGFILFKRLKNVEKANQDGAFGGAPVDASQRSESTPDTPTDGGDHGGAADGGASDGGGGGGGD